MVEFGDELVRRGRIGYYGLITYLDDKIGRLLAALEEQGLAGQHAGGLRLAITARWPGEHGMWRKSNFFEHSARIPMVMRWPGRIPAGKRVPEVVSLVDLVATMVDAARRNDRRRRCPARACCRWRTVILPGARGRTRRSAPTSRMAWPGRWRCCGAGATN